MDDNIVHHLLGGYSEVLASRFCTYTGEPSVFNGTRQYKMKVKKNIPSVLRIGNRNAWVSYIGPSWTCARCGAQGHLAKD